MFNFTKSFSFILALGVYLFVSAKPIWAMCNAFDTIEVSSEQIANAMLDSDNIKFVSFVPDANGGSIFLLVPTDLKKGYDRILGSPDHKGDPRWFINVF